MVKLHFFSYFLEQYQSFSQMLIYERRVWYLAGLYDIVASFKIRVSCLWIIFKFLCHLHPRINVIFNIIQQFLLPIIHSRLLQTRYYVDLTIFQYLIYRYKSNFSQIEILQDSDWPFIMWWMNSEKNDVFQGNSF